MAGLYAPLPTLRRRPRGRLRTARGRCGSLLLHRSGLAPQTPCRSPGALTRIAARTLAPSPICDQLHRRLQPFRHLHDCSGCFRLERSPGGTCTHWKAPPSHGARKERSIRPRRLEIHPKRTSPCRSRYGRKAPKSGLSRSSPRGRASSGEGRERDLRGHQAIADRLPGRTCGFGLSGNLDRANGHVSVGAPTGDPQ